MGDICVDIFFWRFIFFCFIIYVFLVGLILYLLILGFRRRVLDWGDQRFYYSDWFRVWYMIGNLMRFNFVMIKCVGFVKGYYVGRICLRVILLQKRVELRDGESANGVLEVLFKLCLQLEFF